MPATESIQVKIVDARVREYGVGLGDIVPGLEITIEASEALLQAFSVRNLNKGLAVRFGGQVIAEMKLGQILAPGPLETRSWSFALQEELPVLAQRMRFEGTALVFETKPDSAR